MHGNGRCKGRWPLQGILGCLVLTVRDTCREPLPTDAVTFGASVPIHLRSHASVPGQASAPINNHLSLCGRGFGRMRGKGLRGALCCQSEDWEGAGHSLRPFVFPHRRASMRLPRRCKGHLVL